MDLSPQFVFANWKSVRQRKKDFICTGRIVEVSRQRKDNHLPRNSAKIVKIVSTVQRCISAQSILSCWNEQGPEIRYKLVLNRTTFDILFANQYALEMELI